MARYTYKSIIARVARTAFHTLFSFDPACIFDRWPGTTEDSILVARHGFHSTLIPCAATRTFAGLTRAITADQRFAVYDASIAFRSKKTPFPNCGTQLSAIAFLLLLFAEVIHNVDACRDHSST